MVFPVCVLQDMAFWPQEIIYPMHPRLWLQRVKAGTFSFAHGNLDQASMVFAEKGVNLETLFLTIFLEDKEDIPLEVVSAFTLQEDHLMLVNFVEMHTKTSLGTMDSRLMM